jgi:hypothetical protein
MSYRKIYTIDQEELKTIRKQEYTEIIPAELCKKFNDFVSAQYPWVPVTAYRIDWEKLLSYKRFQWDDASNEEIAKFLNTTCLSMFKEVCMVYSYREPGILVAFEFARNNLWSLTSNGWGTRFMVGVKRNSYGVAELVEDCFVEIDCADWLTAPY